MNNEKQIALQHKKKLKVKLTKTTRKKINSNYHP